MNENAGRPSGRSEQISNMDRSPEVIDEAGGKVRETYDLIEK
jgi:hypothetical protein